MAMLTPGQQRAQKLKANNPNYYSDMAKKRSKPYYHFSELKENDPKKLKEISANRKKGEIIDKVLAEEKMCTRKKRYNKSGAQYAAAKRSKESGENLRPYKCNYGRHWHIGHPTK